MKNLIYILAVCMLMISCKEPVKSSKSDNKSSEIINDSNYYFNLSFYSFGTGTDSKAINIFQNFLTEYQNKNNVILKYDTLRWGEEGEFDYRFKLFELSENQKKEFVNKTKELLKDTSLWVGYTENTKK